MNIFTKSTFWNYWMNYLLYWTLLCSSNTDCLSFYFSAPFCLVGLTPLIFDCGIFIIFFIFLVVFSSVGWYRTRLLRRFWLFFLFRAGVLSFSSSNLDYLISSFLSTSDYSYFLIALLVMLANYFSILLIFAISINMRFFFWPIFSSLIPLLSGVAEIWTFLSFIKGNLIVYGAFFFCLIIFIKNSRFTL